MFRRLTGFNTAVPIIALAGGGFALWLFGAFQSVESVAALRAISVVSPAVLTLEERRNRVRWVLGRGATDLVPANVRIESETDAGDHVRRLISYDVESGDRGSAWMFHEKSGVESPRPVVLCLHQTVDCGKDEPAGLCGRPSLHVASELVRRGFACIMPDHFAAGARVPAGEQPFDTAELYRRHPKWSAGGKALWDLQRLLDLLAGMPDIDTGRIGALGVSLGGHDALLLAAMDPRIRAAVVISGSRIMRADPHRANWSRNGAGEFVGYPRLRPYLADPQTLPFDFDDLMYLAAPRSLLMLRDISGDDDPAKCSLDAVVRDIRSGNAQARIDVMYHGQGHDFPPSLHDRVYDWLEQNLRDPD